MGKCNHLVGEKGTEILRNMYEDAMQSSSDSEVRRIKLWVELKKTKI